ncbi:surface antigen BspA-like [Trichomonas vaginalis G3]|uniref:Surface antigen BspA-like n=1 Tax=Trichomonas vaginalis (strain ATCC PRA-98 / G3) TaxID=412133 RepID=A2EPV8_TRIV3|nr:ribonuclease inhibitor domain-containing protein [Trichomonas vaginalis G3]EAY05296.1 surface antigen BspA-like [Trichomonas vaginalis G3]KAI5531871.1 ribonuclease inhibitor domain-containing protein [Trichomonas vaginalis G3]|eukprot:XP_001317519.1 surface antigen BspA-like [Trichomonas vaginalis G3]
MQSAFSGCESLKSIEVPQLEYIYQYAFKGCSKLKSFDFSKVYWIGSNAFYECKSLTSISITNTTTISEEAFAYCSSLKSVDLSGLKAIPDNIFGYCSNLKEIKFNPSTLSIGEKTFHSCGFKELTIPDSILYIGEYAFYNNTKLKKVTLGKGLGKFEHNWFDRSSIKTIVIPSSIKDIHQDAFQYLDNVKIEFSEDNVAYRVEDQALIANVNDSLIVTLGILSKVYTVPKSVKIITANSIRNEHSADLMELSGSGPSLKYPRDQNGGIAGSAILKIPQGDIISMQQPTRYFLRICYKDDKRTDIENDYLPTYSVLDARYATENYHYDTLISSKYFSTGECSEKLTDDYKWRHIEGLSSPEIGLIAFIAVAGVILIVLIVLYLLPLCKHDV